MAWIAAGTLVFAGFWIPVIIAAVRGTARIGLVVLLTLLTPITGVTWFAALVAACTLPRRLRAPRQARPLPQPGPGHPAGAGYGPARQAARPSGAWR